MTKKTKKEIEKVKLKELWNKVEFKIVPKKTTEIGGNYNKEFKGAKK